MIPKGYTIKNQDALHFVTFTVEGWIDVFTRQKYRDIIIDSLSYCQKEQGLIVNAYVIMSNHVHLIIRSETGNLSKTIHNCRKFTAKQILNKIQQPGESRQEWMLHMFRFYGKFIKNIKEHKFWTNSVHPVELYSNKWIRQKLNYIHQNPVRAKLVALPEHYLYSSASNYADGTGLLEVTVMDDIWRDEHLI